MKNLLACLAVFGAITAGAQSMPYNPDANDDGYITSPDLLSFLPLFGSQVGIDSSLTCDYDGTPFESFIVGLMTEDIILDSVYVEYLLLDTLTYFTPGCPDQVIEPIVLERAYFMPAGFIVQSNGYATAASRNLFGFYREFRVSYDESDNTYALSLKDEEVDVLPSHYASDYWDDLSTSSQTAHLTLPFPNHWLIDEDGFQIDWRAARWTSACEYFRLIPYWHYAE